MERNKRRRYERSHRSYKLACQVMPGGVSSNFRLGVHSTAAVYRRANGSKLIDLDENEFIDYALGMGPNILGHGPEKVVAFTAQSLARGQLFAGQHELEYELAL